VHGRCACGSLVSETPGSDVKLSRVQGVRGHHGRGGRARGKAGGGCRLRFGQAAARRDACLASKGRVPFLCFTSLPCSLARKFDRGRRGTCSPGSTFNRPAVVIWVSADLRTDRTCCNSEQVSRAAACARPMRMRAPTGEER
jgi:hypothetical protein